MTSHAWHNSTQITLAHLHKKLTLSSLMRLGVLGSASHSVKKPKKRPVLLVYYFSKPSTDLAVVLGSGHSSRGRAAAARAAARVAVKKAAVHRAEARPVAARAAARLAVVNHCRRDKDRR